MKNINTLEHELSEQHSIADTPHPDKQLEQPGSEGTRLSLDIGTRIELKVEQLETPVESAVVGMIPDKSIIVATPAPFVPITKALQETSAKIAAGFVHMDRLCMFHSRLITSMEDPYQLLFLDYPTSIRNQDLRRARRSRIYIPCTLHPEQEVEHYGILVDMSTSGCLCKISTPENSILPKIDINSRVELRCLLPGLREDQSLHGHVKNLKKNDSQTWIGVEFNNLQNYLQEAIESYLFATD